MQKTTCRNVPRLRSCRAQTNRKEETMQPATSISIRGDLRRAGFAGETLEPGERGYEQARRVWNGCVDRYPELIARPTSPSEVAMAIGFARDRDLPLAV